MTRYKHLWLLPFFTIVISCFGFTMFANQYNDSVQKILNNLETNTNVSRVQVCDSNSITSFNDITNEIAISAISNKGEIGISEKTGTDNPSDNIFIFNIPKLNNYQRATLVYEVKGGANQVICKSINDRLAYYSYINNSDWAQMEEPIDINWLCQGQNSILFTSLKSQKYTIRNIKIVLSEQSPNSITLSSLAIKTASDIYLHGFIQSGISNLKLNGQPIKLKGNEFDVIFNIGNNKPLLTAVDSNGKQISIDVDYFSVNDSYASLFTKRGGTFNKYLANNTQDSVIYENAQLKVSALNIKKDLDVSITSLRDIDMPAMNYGMTNVTADNAGYRFLPHGNHFENEGASISLKYDRTKIPSGYTEADIKTFYFDSEKKQWIALETVALDTKNSCVISKTTHFTDMINGVIQAPESPETEGFTPTMMNDIKIADPVAGMNLISPPSANNRGTANIQYPIEMPPARNGMAPNLAITYNSDVTNGLLGEGWDLNIPSISVDTRWGVPKYNNDIETETYLLNGVMLCTTNGNGEMTVAHRGEKIDRTENRQFYSRIGGDFSQIIRKGNSPSNYYWEITDKHGIVYTYGGNGAVLKGSITDVNGITKEVIAEWKLSKIVEPHNDSIVYTYSIDNEVAIGSLTAKAIYLDNVKAYHAGANNGNPHTIVSLTRDSVKNIQTNNARYGFLTSSNRLLNKISVSFLNNSLRSYSFDYKSGVFDRDILSSITQLDCNNDTVAFHNMDYFDDITSDGELCLYNDQEQWNLHNDDLSAGFINPLTNIGQKNPSALGASKSTSVGGSFYAGVGIMDGSNTKSSTIGMSVGYSSSKTKGISTFMDINGDGLPDKIFKDSGKVYYRPQIISSVNDTAITSYGNPIEIEGLPNISEVKSSTTSGGAKINAGWGPIVATTGPDISTTKTQTTGYFSDVNGDGLVDYISGGKVYFNYLRIVGENKVPTFTTNSATTSNPINFSGTIDVSDLEISNEEQQQIIDNSPMMDAVRLWVAPKNGTIAIEGNISVVEPTGDYDVSEYDKCDGVTACIQIHGSEPLMEELYPGDSISYQCIENVSKGDKVFFRLQSGMDEMSNGNFDEVNWSPIIRYISSSSSPYPTLSENLTPNGDYIDKYYATEGNVYNTNSFVRMADSCSTFSLSGTLTKPVVLTDDIYLRVIGITDDKNAQQKENLLWQSDIFNDDTRTNVPINRTISNPLKYQNIRFEVSSPSNVKWQNIKWEPYISYTYLDSLSNTYKTDTLKGSVKYNTYSEHLLHGAPLTITNPGVNTATYSNRVSPLNESGYYWSLLVKPNVTFSSNYTGKITMKIKSLNKLYLSEEYNVVNGVLQNQYYNSDNNGEVTNGFIGFGLPYTDYPQTMQFWCEFYGEENIPIQTASCSAFTYFYLDGIYEEMGSGIITTTADVFTPISDTRFGSLYRGWGAFVFNSGQDRYGETIDIESETYEDISVEYHNGELSNEKYYLDFRDTPLLMFGVDPNKPNQWSGPNEKIFVTGTKMGSARLAEQDVNQTNPLEDVARYNQTRESSYEVPGVPIVSKNNSSGQVFGLTILSRTDATANGAIESMTMDLNGDSYPDVITKSKIQYTSSTGGISGEEFNLNNFEKLESSAESSSWGSGGDPVAAYSAISNLSKSTDNASKSKIADENSKGGGPSINADGSIGENNDRTITSYIDINGDGLPDLISIATNGTMSVRLNLGYAFSQKISLGYGEINKNQTKSFNAGVGLGFNIGATSISGGFGVASSESKVSDKLIDINGDGLVDKISINENKVIVSLNKGNCFAEEIIWGHINAIDETYSLSESANVAFTATVQIPFLSTKLAFTPSVNVGQSITSQRFDIRDVDGDGFPDIVESESESVLKVSRSTIGRSNKLKSVSNSIGGKFHIDYKHTGASTDFPGGKWVMSSLVVDDGIHDDGALMMNSFDYTNGRRDRYEREFLGFGKVTTNNLDTDNGNAIYRKAVQEFNTSNYYSQGNLLSSYISDAADNLYNKETNEYYSYGVTASGNQYNFETLSPSHNSAYSPLKYNKKESFEGSNTGITLSESWYGYNVTGSGLKFGELATFKYSDKGNLGNNGSGTYDYQTTIEYHNITSNGKYIWGLPNLVTVNSNGNTLLRKSSASYNDNGEILSLTQHLNNGSAITNFEYDAHGNITKRTLPANNTNQRMYYSYAYDTSQNMYVTSITDAYGYNSTLMNYDYRYGIPLKHIDINGRETIYTIDDLGRITSVLSPIDKTDVEIDGYSPYTIKFEYSNAQIDNNGLINKPAKALTYHFNKFTDDNEDYDIMTVAFCDGFGRNIQVQKEAIVGNTQGESAHAMIVSGRTKHDAFGRIIESYYPTIVNYNDNFDFCSTFDNITPTISVYDILDRATQNILPDNTITSYAYNIDTSTQSIVTTITDANDNLNKTYTNGSGKTVKTEQFENSNTAIPTTFEYDGIGQLVKVTDAEGNITSSTYDMGGRVTQVIHPASGTTSYAYDNLGNVIAKRTSNMTIGNAINYNYHFTRLSSVEYPNNPENNISLLYGSDHENNAKGRVLIKTDGSGATEYKYDKLGNITYERRSVVVPNNGIYTFVTQYSYDSFNRLRNMTYPDGEIVTYNYDAGGNVSSVTHNNEAGESNYVDQILYDKFNNRTYMKYGNGIISTYSYDPLRCRLSNMTAGDFINKSYQYDAVSNILSITNDASAGGDMSHSYSYDNLYRLISANGIYSGANNKTASYNLTMEYDNMHRITSKKQFLTQENVKFDGTLYAGYNMSYTYDNDHKFQLSTITDNNYRSVSNPVDSIYNTHTYQYDAIGNLTYVATGRKMKDGHTEDLISERKLLWDDENRLMAISDNGYVSTYRYDDAGNRTVKLSGNGNAVFVCASDSSNGFTQTDRFTAYPNPYMVYNGSRYYKHIYIGSDRIVSKVSANNPDYDPRQVDCAGNEITGYNVKLQSQQQALSDSIASIYAKFEVPYYPNNNDDYGYNWNDGLRRSVATSDSYGELAYFYHSDHLGSTSFVTDANGEVSQQVEYVPFGEVFIEERNNTWNTPYLFNAKELDEETGLYYYGARYYDPRISLWLSTDPMELKYPNISTYAYCVNNPIILIDIAGLEGEIADVLAEYKIFNALPQDIQNQIIKIAEYVCGDECSFNPSRIAVGIEKKVNLSATSGANVEASGAIGNVIFLDGPDAGYAYDYYSGDIGVGIKTTLDVSVGADINVFVAFLSNPDENSEKNHKAFSGKYNYYNGIVEGTAVIGGVNASIGTAIGVVNKGKPYWTIYSMSVGVNVGLDLVPFSFGASGGWGETKFFNYKSVGTPKFIWEKIGSFLF